MKEGSGNSVSFSMGLFEGYLVGGTPLRLVYTGRVTRFSKMGPVT